MMKISSVTNRTLIFSLFIITLSDNKNYVGWHSLVKFLLPRVMSVSLRTSTITGKSMCGGVWWWGVVWCAVAYRCSSHILFLLLSCAVFCSTLLCPPPLCTIPYFFLLFHSVLLRTSLLFLLFSLCYVTTASYPSLPSTSLHFDSFHFTLISSLYYNPILFHPHDTLADLTLISSLLSSLILLTP